MNLRFRLALEWLIIGLVASAMTLAILWTQAAAPVDEDAIRNALLDKIDAKYGGRLKSSGVSGSAGANRPADKQGDAGMTLADALDYARKKAGGKLSPDVERKIRDAYGAD